MTTVFGMLPLALGIGEGSEMMQPLAIAVVGGLSVSMLLTLFVVPSAYLIFNAGAERLGAFVTGGRRKTAEPRVPAEVGAD
jgi:Cu/Ag efflux pump CusA